MSLALIVSGEFIYIFGFNEVVEDTTVCVANCKDHLTKLFLASILVGGGSVINGGYPI